MTKYQMAPMPPRVKRRPPARMMRVSKVLLPESAGLASGWPGSVAESPTVLVPLPWPMVWGLGVVLPALARAWFSASPARAARAMAVASASAVVLASPAGVGEAGVGASPGVSLTVCSMTSVGTGGMSVGASPAGGGGSSCSSRAVGAGSRVAVGSCPAGRGVAVGAAVLLFLLPAGLGRQRLLTWRDATATPWHLLPRTSIAC